MGPLKQLIKDVPVLGPALVRLRGGQHIPFTSSSDYWEQRYRSGGTSGSGSYNRLAHFKAEFLNSFVKDHLIQSVIEFGSGDGAQLTLSNYPEYIGVDISAKSIEMCRRLFTADENKRFLLSSELGAEIRAELSLSLDVIYHLVEDDVFEAYMRQLFTAASRFVIVFSSNMDKVWPDRHVRHRHFTAWVERNMPRWQLQSVTPNAFPYDPRHKETTSFADFHVFEPR